MLVLPCLYQLLSTAKLHPWLLPDFSQSCSPSEQALEPSQPGTVAVAVLRAERQRGEHSLCSVPQPRTPLPAGSGAAGWNGSGLNPPRTQGTGAPERLLSRERAAAMEQHNPLAEE